jgi:hypothetical protein
MRKLITFIGLAVMFCLSAFAQVPLTNSAVQLAGTVQLMPHLYFHSASGWSDAPESPLSDAKRYYWDGTGDDGNGLEFDDEDTLLLVTFSRNGPVIHKVNAYKVQLPFPRKDDGSFGTCYLYLKTGGSPPPKLLSNHRRTIIFNN